MQLILSWDCYIATIKTLPIAWSSRSSLIMIYLYFTSCLSMIYALPVYQTEFVLKDNIKTDTVIRETVSDFIKDLSAVKYYLTNITLTHV